MRAFQELRLYQPTRQAYVVLPLRFTGLNERQYVVTNLAGEFLTVERGTLQRFLRHERREGELVKLSTVQPGSEGAR